MSKLYRTTITIWSEYDPFDTDIEDLARDAISGEAIADGKHTDVFDASDEAVPEGVLSFFNLLEE